MAQAPPARRGGTGHLMTTVTEIRPMIIREMSWSVTTSCRRAVYSGDRFYLTRSPRGLDTGRGLAAMRGPHRHEESAASPWPAPPLQGRDEHQLRRQSRIMYKVSGHRAGLHRQPRSSAGSTGASTSPAARSSSRRCRPALEQGVSDAIQNAGVTVTSIQTARPATPRTT